MIVTSSYSQMKNFTKEGFIPVSISVSEPKYIKTPVRKISVLQPRYAILKENDYDIYKRIYVADMLKLAHIHAKLGSLSYILQHPG